MDFFFLEAGDCLENKKFSNNFSSTGIIGEIAQLLKVSATAVGVYAPYNFSWN